MFNNIYIYSRFMPTYTYLYMMRLHPHIAGAFCLIYSAQRRAAEAEASEGAVPSRLSRSPYSIPIHAYIALVSLFLCLSSGFVLCAASYSARARRQRRTSRTHTMSKRRRRPAGGAGERAGDSTMTAPRPRRGRGAVCVLVPRPRHKRQEQAEQQIHTATPAALWCVRVRMWWWGWGAAGLTLDHVNQLDAREKDRTSSRADKRPRASRCIQDWRATASEHASGVQRKRRRETRGPTVFPCAAFHGSAC
jgi:hypothetical protein